MNNKVFYFDVESSGLDSKLNDILSLAYLIEINKEIVETGELFMQPFNYNTINAKALEVNKLSIAQIKEFPTPQETHIELVKLFDRYIDKFNKNDKFISCGYNVRFDVAFLSEFFLKNNHKYLFSYIDHHQLDVFNLLYILDYKGILNLESYKLENVAKYFGIEHAAHNSLSDIKVTRQIFYKLLEYFK